MQCRLCRETEKDMDKGECVVEKCRRNGGFTLVEILVVIAIVAIMGGSMIAGFSNLSYANFKKAAGKINNEISDCRAICMSHADPVYTYVYNDGGSIYVLTSKTGNMNFSALSSAGGTKVGSSIITFDYVDASGASNTLSDGNFVEISFKMNGSFRTAPPTGGGSTAYYKSFTVSGKNGKRTITLTQETGKHYMN